MTKARENIGSNSSPEAVQLAKRISDLKNNVDGQRLIFFNHKVFNLERITEVVKTVDMVGRDARRKDYMNELLGYYPNIKDYRNEFSSSVTPYLSSELRIRASIIEATYNLFE